MAPPPPPSTLTPYTTLFRSRPVRSDRRSGARQRRGGDRMYPPDYLYTQDHEWVGVVGDVGVLGITQFAQQELRSGEHTSELQSPCKLVCRLLLEKKNNKSRE